MSHNMSPMTQRCTLLSTAVLAVSEKDLYQQNCVYESSGFPNLIVIPINSSPCTHISVLSLLLYPTDSPDSEERPSGPRRAFIRPPLTHHPAIMGGGTMGNTIGSTRRAVVSSGLVCPLCRPLSLQYRLTTLADVVSQLHLKTM